MAEDVITLKFNVETKSLNDLEKNLVSLKSKIKDVGIGSEDFKKLQGEIIKAEAQVKNLNKSFEGLDKEALAGEFGKLAGGITAAFGGIGAMISKDNAVVGALTDSIAKSMAIVQGIEGATEAWTAAQKLLNDALSTNPIGLIVTAVGLLVAGIVALISNSEKVKSSLDTLAQKFTFLQGPIDVIKAGIDGLVQAWRNVQKFIMGDDAYEKMIDERIKNMRDKAKKDKANRDLEEMRRNKEKNEESLKQLTDKENKAKEIADKARQKKEEAEKKAEEEAKQRLADRETAMKEEADMKDAYYELEKQKAKDNADQLYEIESKNIQDKLDLLNSYRNSTGDLSEEDQLAYAQALQAKADLDKQYADQKSEYELKRREDEAQYQQDLQDAKDELRQTEIDNYDSDYEREKARLEFEKQKYQTEIDQMNSLGVMNEEQTARYIALQNRKNNVDKQLDKLDRDRKINNWELTSQLLGNAASLFEENTVAYKLFASAQVIIETALGAMRAYNSMLNIPVVGVALGAIAAGVVIAAGAMQLAKINGVQFADGGVLNGPSHAQGGILTPFGEVEGGEGIINNRSMSNASLRNMASAANVAGGGRDFSAGDGSIRLSPESIAAINDKKVYVAEQDITKVQNKVKVYENNATY